jgi:hypothetical protein
MPDCAGESPASAGGMVECLQRTSSTPVKHPHHAREQGTRLVGGSGNAEVQDPLGPCWPSSCGGGMPLPLRPCGASDAVSVVGWGAP